MDLTDADLDELIACPKRISKAPRREMKAEGAHCRNDMELESLDGKHGFRVFIRQHREFEENFSIGMDYLPKEEPGSFCLIRCNGRHGAHSAHPHHLTCHIHRSNVEDVNARSITPTNEYAAFKDALRYFLNRVNIQQPDLALYFPNLISGVQGEMFEDEATS